MHELYKNIDRAGESQMKCFIGRMVNLLCLLVGWAFNIDAAYRLLSTEQVKQPTQVPASMAKVQAPNLAMQYKFDPAKSSMLGAQKNAGKSGVSGRANARASSADLNWALSDVSVEDIDAIPVTLSSQKSVQPQGVGARMLSQSLAMQDIQPARPWIALQAEQSKQQIQAEVGSFDQVNPMQKRVSDRVAIDDKSLPGVGLQSQDNAQKLGNNFVQKNPLSKYYSAVKPDIVRSGKLAKVIEQDVVAQEPVVTLTSEPIAIAEPVVQQPQRPKIDLTQVRTRVAKPSQAELEQGVNASAPQVKVYTVKQNYLQDRFAAEEQAQVDAIKPYNRQATEEFNAKWPAVLQDYKQKRQALNVPIDEARVDLLQSQTKKQILDKILEDNKTQIDAFVQRKITEFDANNIFQAPTKKLGTAQLVNSNNLAQKEIENKMRSFAEQEARDSILNPRILAKFPENLQEVWVEDFKHDYELKNQKKAPLSEVNKALAEHKKSIELELYSTLSAEEKLGIKQVGNKAVSQWKEKQQNRSVSPQTVAVDVSRSVTPELSQS